jgi:hypothetical protein
MREHHRKTRITLEPQKGMENVPSVYTAPKSPPLVAGNSCHQNTGTTIDDGLIVQRTADGHIVVIRHAIEDKCFSC